MLCGKIVKTYLLFSSCHLVFSYGVSVVEKVWLTELKLKLNHRSLKYNYNQGQKNIKTGTFAFALSKIWF